MKLLASCFFTMYILSCTYPVKQQETNQKNQASINPIPSDRRGIKIKDLKTATSSIDTIKKYGFSDLNDSLKKIIYGINGFCFYEGQGTWFPAMFNIVLVEVRKISQRCFEFTYSIFANDSSAVLLEFKAGCFKINTFEYDYIEKKIKRTYIGQESSYIDGEGIISVYRKRVNNTDFKKNVQKFYQYLNPEFIRVMGDVIKQ